MRRVLLAAIVVFTSVGCGPGGESSAELGGKGGPCYDDGTCDEGLSCNEDSRCVVSDCVPLCLGRTCGPDPVCGQSCGTCPEGQHCLTTGQCGSDDPSEVNWVRIPGGSFWMGYDGYDAFEAEQPLHEVTVATFEMLRTEVTVAQYGACVDDVFCQPPDRESEYCNWGVPGREDHPLNCVSSIWASAFCRWVGGRLPTESEWEYAARSAGEDWLYPWGDRPPSCEYAVMDDDPQQARGCGAGGTMPVCSKSPAGDTLQGLCDMAGNVQEWVEDDWHGSYDGDGDGDVNGSADHPRDGSAWVNHPRDYYVYRGGDWYTGQHLQFRVSFRKRDTPFQEDIVYGIRCVRSAE